jgi:tetratricopeptide (TPR) repeat protein
VAPSSPRPLDRAHALGFRAVAELYQRRVAGLAPLLEESLALFRQCGDDWGAALSLLRLGMAAWIGGDFDRAVPLCREALAAFEALGNAWGIAAARANLAEALLGRGDLDGAHDAYFASFDPLERIGSSWYLAQNAAGFAGVLARRGDPVTAARLLAAARASLTATRSTLPPIDRHIYEQSLAAVRARIDQASFERAWDEGHGLPLTRAIAEARSRR